MANSYNELFGLGSHSEDANLEGWWPLQDDAASTVVDDVSSNATDGALQGGDNTSAKSTTGPNSWLPKALDFNGTDDRVVAVLGGAIGSALSILGRFSPDDTTTFKLAAALGDGASGDNYRGLQFTDTPTVRLPFRDTSFSSLVGGAYSAATWYDLGAVYPTNASQKLYQNGSSYSSSVSKSITSGDDFYIGTFPAGTGWYNGKAADVSVWSREITSAEVSEWRNGPEPINSVAPAVTGTETDGQTLSCTTGTWGLDSPFSGGSNGTITYSYQWTRSDDGSGTGEADIGSATASTYTLTGTDIGKFIRCRVRGTNTGGFDSAADTNSNFTGAIGSVSVSRRRQLLTAM